MLYKYSSYDENCHDGIVNKYFWFSKPKYFNDPFDCNMDILKTSSFLMQKLENKDQIWDFKHETLFDYIKETTEDFGILCFTSSTNKEGFADKGYNNLYFWSHYAKNHTGIALGYDRNILEDYLEKLKCNTKLMPVKYGSGALNIETYEFIINEEEGNTIKTRIRGIFNGDYPKRREKFFETILLYKDKRIWEIENESRIILGGIAKSKLEEDSVNIFPEFPYKIIEDAGYRVPYPKDVLKEVTFGAKFNSNEIKCAIYKIKNIHSNVKFYRAELDIKNANIIRKEINE